MSFIVKGIDLPKEGEMHLIISKNGIVCSAEYPNKIKHAYLLNLESQAIQIPKSHGKIVDLDDLVVKYWDGNYMEIDNEAYDNAIVILEAEE